MVVGRGVAQIEAYPSSLLNIDVSLTFWKENYASVFSNSDCFIAFNVVSDFAMNSNELLVIAIWFLYHMTNTRSNFMASHCHVSRLMLVSSWMMKLLRFWLSCFSKIALLVYMCICTFEWSSLCIFILFILWLTCIHFIQTGTTHLMPQLLPI